MPRLVRESAIYVVLLISAALLVHPDLIVAPAKRFDAMIESGKYLHPFAYTAVLYAVVWPIRLLVRVGKRLFSRLTNTPSH